MQQSLSHVRQNVSLPFAVQQHLHVYFAREAVGAPLMLHRCEQHPLIQVRTAGRGWPQYGSKISRGVIAAFAAGHERKQDQHT